MAASPMLILATHATRRTPAPGRVARRVALAMVVGALGSIASAAASQAAGGIPDLTGAWARVDETGFGSFDKLAEGFAQASLTLAYVVTAGTCTFPGGIEPNSAAFHIVQDRDEVVIVRENPGLGRNIYMDGRPHPDTGRFLPTATGHSVGHYEGRALVFETIGLTTGGVPAGGYSKPETRLVDRYSLSPDGNRLTMRYTFTDPKIYTKPHSFEIVAERGQPRQLAFEWYCDAADPKQSQGVVPPRQD